MPETTADPFDALGDPHRREILRLLGERDLAVHQIAEHLPISRPAVSRHLRMLKDAGLVEEQPEGTRRIYRLQVRGMRAVQAYLEQVWGQAAARFRPVVENVADAGPALHRNHRVRSTPTGEVSTVAAGSGTKEDPWRLTTAPGSSSYTMHRDETADPPLLVCQVGSTRLTYLLRAIDDLPGWLREQGGWVPLGAADEKKPAPDGSVEAWGRDPENPVGGWYGQRNGYRGRFGMYLPPLLEVLGLVELTHDARNNTVRAR